MALLGGGGRADFARPAEALEAEQRGKADASAETSVVLLIVAPLLSVRRLRLRAAEALRSVSKIADARCRFGLSIARVRPCWTAAALAWRWQPRYGGTDVREC